jgi:catalase
MGQRESKLMAKKIEIMTATGGNPVAHNQNSNTAGPRGPLLMQDCWKSSLTRIASAFLSALSTPRARRLSAR